MKQEPDGVRAKTRFTPKVPPRKISKPVVPKEELSANNDDVINKELLAKIDRAKTNDAFGRRFPRDEKKVAPTEVAFGQASSRSARSFHHVASYAKNNGLPKEYVEPWDYANSYYPLALPLRRPYSGDPELLDKEEFGEASTSAPPFENPEHNPAEELGLMGQIEEPQLLFFQFPAIVPLMKQAASDADNKGATGHRPDKF